MLNTAMAVGAALVAVAFALSTFDRWLTKRRPYELAWTVAFALFAIAAVFMAVGADAGWTSARFRGFYLFGAIVNVPFLGLGTILLLTGGQFGRRAIMATCGFCVFATGVMVAAPVLHGVPRATLAQGSQVFGVLPRVLAGVGSGVGATIVFAGALWSALRRRQRKNILANMLIAAGTTVSGLSGLLNSVFGEMTAFSVTLTVGITLIFLGFLVATSTQNAGSGTS